MASWRGTQVAVKKLGDELFTDEDKVWVIQLPTICFYMFYAGFYTFYNVVYRCYIVVSMFLYVLYRFCIGFV